ncbi:hypothetical protein VTN96DRAFT_3239 [Rasamsonia emersonii]
MMRGFGEAEGGEGAREKRRSVTARGTGLGAGREIKVCLSGSQGLPCRLARFGRSGSAPAECRPTRPRPLAVTGWPKIAAPIAPRSSLAYCSVSKVPCMNCTTNRPSLSRSSVEVAECGWKIVSGAPLNTQRAIADDRGKDDEITPATRVLAVCGCRHRIEKAPPDPVFQVTWNPSTQTVAVSLVQSGQDDDCTVAALSLGTSVTRHVASSTSRGPFKTTTIIQEKIARQQHEAGLPL